MSNIHVFTSAAFNYIPKVRMLFQSLRQHHPEWRLHLALADEPRPGVDLSREPFDEIWPASELDKMCIRDSHYAGCCDKVSRRLDISDSGYHYQNQGRYYSLRR